MNKPTFNSSFCKKWPLSQQFLDRTTIARNIKFTKSYLSRITKTWLWQFFSVFHILGIFSKLCPKMAKFANQVRPKNIKSLKDTNAIVSNFNESNMFFLQNIST